jgi:KaiC/GvpD/RAD55 family RecA-like ATPase
MAKRSTSKKVDKAVARAKDETSRREPDAASKRKAALLEVSLGRRCAMSAAVAWATLSMLATLIYIADPSLETDPLFTVLAVLIPFGPAIAGVAVSGTAVMTKRGNLLAGFLVEAHNVATLLGLSVSVAALAVAIGIFAGSFPSSTLFFTYPVGVAGITLGMLGYVLTWKGWSPRKIVAILCSVVPAILFVGHVFQPTSIAALLVWEYTIGGGLYLVAGIIFVVSMTATTGAEREIVKGANERVAMEYAAVTARRKELETSLERNSQRAAELEEDAAQIEAKRRQAEDYLSQAEHVKGEATALFDRATKSDAELRTKLAATQGKAAAVEAREKELAAMALRRAEEERQLTELRKAVIQQKADADGANRKAEAEKQAAAEQLSHAKRDRESARGTLQAAEERSREADSKLQQARDMLQRGEEQKQVLSAQVKTVDSERVRALEDVQKKLNAERTALEQQRAAFAAEKARVERTAKDFTEKEKTLQTRAKELDVHEKSLGDSMKKISSEKAEAEALKRKADAAMAEAGERSRSYSDSVTKVSELEAKARQQQEALHAAERRLQEREARTKEFEAEVQRRLQQLTEDRKAIAAERERNQVEGERLKEREQAIFTFEKHPEFAKEAAAALEAELAVPKAPAPAASPARAKGPKTEPMPTIVSLPPAETEGRLSFGNPRLDELTGGGMPKGTSLLVVGPAFCGKEAVPLGFIAGGLEEDVPAIVVTTVKGPGEIVEELQAMCAPKGKANILKLVRWVDASGKGQRGDVPRGSIIDVASPSDFAKIKDAVAKHWTALSGSHKSFRFAYVPLTESWRHAEPTVARTFVQQMVAATRKQEGGAVWVAESGIHSADEVESLANMMQGVVRIQEDREGHSLKVQGVPGTRTHQWVKYRHSPRGLDLGSFELERIR